MLVDGVIDGPREGSTLLEGRLLGDCDGNFVGKELGASVGGGRSGPSFGSASSLVPNGLNVKGMSQTSVSGH